MKFTKWIYLLIAILIFASCRGEGIFYTLRDEVEIANSSFPDDAVMRDVFQHGGNYIAVGKRIWIKSGGSWSVIPLPAGVDNSDALTSAVSFGVNIIASYYIDDNETKIYSYDGSSWTSIASNLPSTSDNYYLFTASTGLFVNRRSRGEESPSRSYIYYFTSTNLTTWTALTDGGASDIVQPMIGVAYNSVDLLYWLICNSGDSKDNDGILRRYSGGAGAFTNSPTAPNAGSDFSTIKYTAPNIILAGYTDNSSTIYVSGDNGNNWTSTSVPDDKIIHSISNLHPTANVFVAGVENRDNQNNQGIMEIASDGSYVRENTVLSNDNNYDSSELKTAQVLGFALDGDDLYAASTQGMWLLDYPSKDWKQE